MRISIIVATGLGNEIGFNGDLLWKNQKADMKFFKDTTLGKCVISGRKNYESIPEKFRPLPGRMNVVVSRDPEYNCHPDVALASSLENAIGRFKQRWPHEACKDDCEVFIIGGGQIYKEAIEKNMVDRIYLTTVESFFSEVDTFFPDLASGEWTQISRTYIPSDEKNDHSMNFQILDRTRKKLTFDDIIVHIDNLNVSVEDLILEEFMGDGHTFGPNPKMAELRKLVGKHKIVESAYDYEDHQIIIKFNDHDVYVRIYGWVGSSMEETSWDDKIVQVFSRQVNKTIYESAQDVNDNID